MPPTVTFPEIPVSILILPVAPEVEMVPAVVMLPLLLSILMFPFVASAVIFPLSVITPAPEEIISTSAFPVITPATVMPPSMLSISMVAATPETVIVLPKEIVPLAEVFSERPWSTVTASAKVTEVAKEPDAYPMLITSTFTVPETRSDVLPLISKVSKEGELPLPPTEPLIVIAPSTAVRIKSSVDASPSTLPVMAIVPVPTVVMAAAL